jgi:hypothetical protein
VTVGPTAVERAVEDEGIGCPSAPSCSAYRFLARTSRIGTGVSRVSDRTFPVRSTSPEERSRSCISYNHKRARRQATRRKEKKEAIRHDGRTVNVDSTSSLLQNSVEDGLLLIVPLSLVEGGGNESGSVSASERSRSSGKLADLKGRRPISGAFEG